MLMFLQATPTRRTLATPLPSAAPKSTCWYVATPAPFPMTLHNEP